MPDQRVLCPTCNYLVRPEHFPCRKTLYHQRKIFMEKVIEYVKKNSWFDLDENHDNCLEFSSRVHGYVGDERPGQEDVTEAMRLTKILTEKFKVHARIETVDEWTLLFISQNPF